MTGSLPFIPGDKWDEQVRGSKYSGAELDTYSDVKQEMNVRNA